MSRRPRTDRTRPPRARPPQPAPVEATLTLHGWAHGGEAVGRLEDGMACFVAYALPGETVRVLVTTRRKRWARAQLLEVLQPSPHRVTPPCPHYGPDACGGCVLQHVAPDHQLELKAQVLTDQLVRIGRVADPPSIQVRPVGPTWPSAYRAWARMAVDAQGRLGFRRHASHDVHHVDRCLLMDPAADTLRQEAGDHWSGAEEVSLMAGSDRAVLTLAPGPGGLPTAPAGTFGVAIQGASEAEVIRPPAAVTMQVGPHPLRVSAGSFFQPGVPAAQALAQVVLELGQPGPGARALDLYAGVGLFSVFLGDAGASVVAVESNPSAVADARHNVAGLPVEVIAEEVATALPGLGPADLVVLDPPRSGAGREVCQALAAMQPRRLVYVACDPAALARDTAILGAAGMTLDAVIGLDAFGHTAHVEAVALFTAFTAEA